MPRTAGCEATNDRSAGERQRPLLPSSVRRASAFVAATRANQPADRTFDRGLTIAFQTPALQPLWDGLASGLAFVGVVVFVIGAMMSALLVASGLLLRRSMALGRRVERLEMALAQRNTPLEADSRKPPLTYLEARR